MKPLGNSKRHFWLAQRMAKTTGADLVSAYDQGALDQQEWAQMVHNCRGCDWNKDCERWLSTRDNAAEVPENCDNCAQFTLLKAEAQANGSERT